MDRSLTSPKTTPFSINDILTKNNTTILRRNSSGHLSPIEKKIHEKDCDQMTEPTDDLSLHLSNSMHFLKYSPRHYENNSNIDQSMAMRRSSQNHLSNNNNNKMHNANEVRNKRHSNSDKTLKPLRFYNFPLMLERPLDMRRCADDDDSGEKIILFYIQ